MKKLLLIILVTIFLSCDDSPSQESSKKEPSKQESSAKEKEKSLTEKVYILTDLSLKSDSEKIGLISIIKDVPLEKVYSVLRDYKSKKLLFLFKREGSKSIIEMVDSLSKKNKISKKMTASIIFSYEYEMITESEIIDEYNSGKDYFENDPDFD